MKIVMDFRKYDGVVGGVEQGVIQVSKYLANNGHGIILLCKQKKLDDVTSIFESNSGIKIIPLQVSSHGITKENAHLDSTVIQNIAVKEKADVIHFFYNWSFPENKKVPCVLTVHDVIPFTFREAQKLFINLFKYKPGIKKACRLNDIITTVSEFSRQDIARKVGVSLDKIKVIHNGLREPNPEDKNLELNLRKRFVLGNDRFILNVGGIHERKNIVRLIKSFSALVKDKGYSGKLVITGKVTGAPYQIKMKRLCNNAIHQTGMEERIVFTDFISEKELDSLFRMADMMIYPSLYEGFGIPILEAMKLSVPVITSNVTAMPQVTENAGILVDPYSVPDMTNAISRLLDNPVLRKDLIEKGYKHSEAFTWTKAANKYLSVYEELLKTGKSQP